MVLKELKNVTKGTILIGPNERKTLDTAADVLDKILFLIEYNIDGDVEDAAITNYGNSLITTGEELNDIRVFLKKLSKITDINFKEGKE